MKAGKTFCICLFLALAETIFLVWFSFLPSVSVVTPEVLLRPGDLEHVAAYAVYGFLWAKVLGHYWTDARKRALLALLLPAAIGSLVGGGCEFIQMFVPTRTADVMDWLADTLGSLLGALVAVKIEAVFTSKLKALFKFK